MAIIPTRAAFAIGLLMATFPMCSHANPLTVGDYVRSKSELKKYDQMTEADKLRYYATNKEQLLQAHQTLEDVQSTYNGIIEANKWAMAHYGRAFLCDAATPPIEQVISEYSRRKSQESKIDSEETRTRVDQIPVELVLADEVLRLQPCPDWKN